MQREVNTASHSSFFFFLNSFPCRFSDGHGGVYRERSKRKEAPLILRKREEIQLFSKVHAFSLKTPTFFFPPMSLPLSNYISFFFLTQTGEHISCWLFFFLLSSLPFRTPLSHGSKGIINNNKEPLHYLTTSTVSFFFFSYYQQKVLPLTHKRIGGKKKKEHRQEQQ